MKTRRKIEEHFIRKITKTSSGTSYGVTLPIEIVRKWKWREKQKVVLEVDDEKKTILIRDWSKNE